MSKSVETKTKLLLTASKLFQKQGYHATGLNQIIKESGCPKGSLYYYFPEGKEQLATEAINRVKERAVKEVKEMFSQFDDVVDALDHYLKIVSNYDPKMEVDGIPLALLSLETSQMSERLRLACKAAYDSLLNLLEEKFIESNWPKSDAEELSFLIAVMMEGTGIFAFTHLSNEPLKRMHRSIMQLVKDRQKEIFDEKQC